MNTTDITYQLKISITPFEVTTKMMVTSLLSSIGVSTIVEGYYDHEDDKGLLEDNDYKKSFFDDEVAPGPVCIYSYIKKDLEAHEKKLIKYFGNKIKTSITSFASSTWKDSWKKGFEPIKTKKFHILAPWHKKPSKECLQLPIIIDPGMAFGTGQHATTQLCLELIDDYHSNFGSQQHLTRVLDVGCGSGILAIACAKLGYRTVRACDISADAVLATKVNAKENHVTIDVIKDDFTSSSTYTKDDSGYQLILANILFEPLVEMFFCFNKLKKGKPQHIIISGILDEQAEELATVAKKHNYTLLKTANNKGWSALLFVG